MAWANSSKSLLARVRSLGLSLSGVGFPFKYSSSLRDAAYFRNVGRPVNFQRADAEDLLKEEFVLAQGELPHHASRIWIGHFFGIRWRVLGLLRCGILQFVSCRPAIPEVAPVEIGLTLVEMERRVVSCVNVTRLGSASQSGY